MLRICGDNATVGGGHPEWLMNLVDMLVDNDMNLVDMFVDKASGTLIFRVAHCAFAQCIAFCAVVVLFLYCTIAIVFAQYYLFILGSTLLRHCCSASFVA